MAIEREVNLKISALTDGGDKIRGLAKDVDELAAKGGDAAPAFQKLSQELHSLADQQELISQFGELKRQTIESKDALEQTTTATRAAALAMRNEKEALTTATAARRETAVSAKQWNDKLAENKIALAQSKAELAGYTAEVAKSGTATEAQKAAMASVKAAMAQYNAGIAEAKAQLAVLAPAQKEQAEAVRHSEAALKDATRAFERNRAAAADAKSAYEQTNTSLQATRDKMHEMGVSSDNLAAAQIELSQRFSRSGVAAEKLESDVARLAARERELGGIRAFESQAADARKMLEAAQYVRFWTEAMDRADAQARQTAEAAKQAGEKISNAFRTLGIRSADELQAEIAQVRAALDTVKSGAGVTGGALNGAFAAGKARIAELERELRKTSGTLTMADRAASLFKNTMSQIAAGNVIADGMGFLVNKVKELGAAFITTIAAQQQMRRALTAIYKDSQVAGQQFEFLRRTAMASGVAVGDISAGFTKFAAAARASGIPMQVMNDLFQSVTLAAGTLGLRGEDVTGMLEALQQMASKGTVSMEELRQQLGDRLPGALGLVAKGLGLTQAQLIKLVENGGLAARDLFPALTESLKEMHGEITGLVPAYAQLKNVLTATAENAGDSMWAAVLTKALEGLTIAAGAVGRVFADVSAGIEVFAKANGILFGSIVTLTNPIDALKEMLDDVSERQGKFGKSIDDVVWKNKEATKAQEAHNKKLTETGAAAAQASMAVTSTAKAQLAQAEAARLAADRTTDLGAKIVQLKAFIDTLLATQAKEIEAAGKLAAAAKIQGDSLVKLTELRGQEFLTLEAQVEATNKNVAAADRLADAHRTETELLTLKRDEIIRTAMAQGGNTLARQDEIDKINQKIIASEAETEKSRAAAAALRQEAEMRALAVQTYRDNSVAVAEYAAAVAAAQVTLDAMLIAQRDGLATDEDVARAKGNVAKATFLYNDAVKDGLANLELESRLKQANTNLTLAGMQAEVGALQTKLAAARASGGYYQAVELEIQIRLKKIEMIKVSMKAQEAEIKNSIRILEIQREEIKGSDALAAQKRAEIDAHLANAKAKLVAAGAGKEAVAALELEIKALRENAGAREGTGHGIDRDTDRRDRNTGAIHRQTQALQQQNSVGGAFNDVGDFTKNGREGEIYTDPVTGITYSKNSAGQMGSTGMMGSHTLSDFEHLKMRTQSAIFKPEDFTEQDLATAKANFLAQEANRNAMQRSTSGLYDYGGETSQDNAYREAKNFVEKIERALTEKTTKAGTSAEPAAAKALSQFPSRTVDIRINGRSKPVNVASQADADNLVGILRQLESAAGVFA